MYVWNGVQSRMLLGTSLSQSSSTNWNTARASLITLEDSIRTTGLCGKYWEFLVYMHSVAFSCGLENRNLLRIM
jgi:hypothetical protein